MALTQTVPDMLRLALASSSAKFSDAPFARSNVAVWLKAIPTVSPASTLPTTCIGAAVATVSLSPGWGTPFADQSCGLDALLLPPPTQNRAGIGLVGVP